MPAVPSTPYHHGQLREALLTAALAEMARSGGSTFSLSEMARNVGVTPAAAYKHFKDKNDLLAQLAERGFGMLADHFERATPLASRALNAQQAKLRFERLGEAYLDFAQTEPALFGLIFGEAAAPYRQLVLGGEGRTPTFNYLAVALEDLHAFGVTSRAPTASDQWLAWSAIHGAAKLLSAGILSLVPPQDAAKVITSGLIGSLQT